MFALPSVPCISLFVHLLRPLVEDEDEQVVPEAVATSTSCAVIPQIADSLLMRSYYSGPVGGAAKKLKAVKADAGAGGDGKKRKAAKVDANAMYVAVLYRCRPLNLCLPSAHSKPVPTKRKASRSSSSSSTIDNAMMSPLDKWMQEWGPL